MEAKQAGSLLPTVLSLVDKAARRKQELNERLLAVLSPALKLGDGTRDHSMSWAAAMVVVVLLVVPHLHFPFARLTFRPVPRSVGVPPLHGAERQAFFRGGRVPLPPVEELVLQRLSVPRTVSATYPQWEPVLYKVQEGDTLFGIAARFGLDVRTVLWANESLAKAPDLLSLGQELVILPVDGAYHTVAPGDTLESIAAKYKVPVEAILSYKGNDIPDPQHLAVGTKLIIPGAVLPDLPPKVVNTPAPRRTQQVRVANPQQGSGSLIWPVAGMISQGPHAGHVAVDIAGPAGDPVVAADSGTVVLVSWMRYSYGYHVIIDHGNGLQTLYAHLSDILVEAGQNVSKGEVIGRRGCTGRCTGPHLHFEVRENGVQRNPFAYLP